MGTGKLEFMIVQVNRLMPFQIVVNMVGSGVRECVNDTNGSAILEMELMGLSVDGYR